MSVTPSMCCPFLTRHHPWYLKNYVKCDPHIDRKKLEIVPQLRASCTSLLLLKSRNKNNMLEENDMEMQPLKTRIIFWLFTC